MRFSWRRRSSSSLRMTSRMMFLSSTVRPSRSSRSIMLQPHTDHSNTKSETIAWGQQSLLKKLTDQQLKMDNVPRTNPIYLPMWCLLIFLFSNPVFYFYFFSCCYLWYCGAFCSHPPPSVRGVCVCVCVCVCGAHVCVCWGEDLVIVFMLGFFTSQLSSFMQFKELPESCQHC